MTELTFTPGKDGEGKEDVHGDGKPYWWVSDCGRYTLSRSWLFAETRWVFHAWIRQRDEKGYWLPATLIPGKYRTQGMAQRALEKFLTLSTEEAAKALA